MTMSSIKVNKHAVNSLGLAKDGTISPPKGVVQYYTGSVKPGDVGNSVIAAHVTYNGPDVFAHLNKAKRGDKVQVVDAQGTTRTFTVTKTATVDKDELQKNQDVWGPSSKRNLVLISCDATSPWEDASQHHRTDNIVVWTTLTETKRA